ncbi:MAG TPA: peptidylprolyl isomerase [Thermoanaerobaculia bacterium]|nr:peptidylprolyl isomerase [Thermoanaerobaculia bacterium]
MKTKRSTAALAAVLGSLAALGCQTASTPAAATTAAAAPTPVPTARAPVAAEHIRLQHILISFAGKIRGKNVTRTEDEARALAAQVLDRAKKGEDFDELVRTYTDDRAPGIYALSNSGVTPATGEYSRDRMVPAFGNVGFTLAPGEIGMAEYDPRTSPYGWHIIKRLE